MYCKKFDDLSVLQQSKWKTMLKRCVSVNLRLVYGPNGTPNDLLWYRFIAGELDRISKVVYARPYLHNTQSLCKDTRGIDLVLDGPKKQLEHFMRTLRGLQMREKATIGSSTVLLDQVIQKNRNEELENIYDSLEQQRDILRKKNACGLKRCEPVVTVAPWIFDSSIQLVPSSDDEKTLKQKTDEFYATVTKFHNSDHIMMALEPTLYKDIESMPSAMRRWFTGADRQGEFKQKRQDVLDILSHGFKGFL